ncbi:hypothetical protein K438DRAFT_1806219 [Mycena galopus ATCC 62051]|nr:hypothetical protein K438DRAFT_1806219 [Mycena galopus ATCC 62051]
MCHRQLFFTKVINPSKFYDRKLIFLVSNLHPPSYPLQPNIFAYAPQSCSWSLFPRWLDQARRCGHSTLSSEIMVDCQSRYCRLSRAHPLNCQRCTCRRYYGEFVRLAALLALKFHRATRTFSISRGALEIFLSHVNG